MSRPWMRCINFYSALHSRCRWMREGFRANRAARSIGLAADVTPLGSSKAIVSLTSRAAGNSGRATEENVETTGSDYFSVDASFHPSAAKPIRFGTMQSRRRYQSRDTEPDARGPQGPHSE